MMEQKPIVNALTVDVEDYFMVSAFADIVKFQDWPQYESRIEVNTQKVLELLSEHNVKATFFVLGWIAECYPALVRAISSAGHEVASHGYNHRLIYNLTPDEFREDVRISREILEDIIGAPVVGFRAASYSVTKKSLWALDILMEEGFKYDSSIFPIHHDRYGFPKFSRFPTIIKRQAGKLLEIPPSTIRIWGKNIPIAGGGYLRLLPISVVKWGIRSINEKEQQPAVIYFHPWEIDHKQPRLNGNRLSVFRHYINIDKTAQKLCSMLSIFRFGSIKDIFADKLTTDSSSDVLYYSK